ncbi:flagellin [Tyzzerella sp. OttesenSCG-928-J15]|nr:flagellin [Tyzzerella sp. OttesenSCG-928-J15]
MVVRTNVLSINSHRNLKTVGTQQSKASARLSSGYKINSAADDASGLAISEKMRAQIRGLDQASTNSQDAISLIQTAEGGMQEIDNMIQRIRELTVKASNDTLESAAGTDRQKIADEVDQLAKEIDAMASRVEFNKKKVINGSFATQSLHFQVGANSSQSLQLTIGGVSNGLIASGATTGIDLSTLATQISGATLGSVLTTLIDRVDADLQYVTKQRSLLGAAQNRLEYTIKSLDISSENLSASESRIRDTDMAKEMMNLTQANVLQQAATSMLAQANQAPQSVLQLLQ